MEKKYYLGILHGFKNGKGVAEKESDLKEHSVQRDMQFVQLNEKKQIEKSLDKWIHDG